MHARGMTAEYYPSAQAFFASGPCRDKRGIAIVDIHMPESDGFALLDKMRAQQCGLPVIMVTAHSYRDAEARARQKGTVGFLYKPFSEDALMRLITAHAERAEA